MHTWGAPKPTSLRLGIGAGCPITAAGQQALPNPSEAENGAPLPRHIIAKPCFIKVYRGKLPMLWINLPTELITSTGACTSKLVEEAFHNGHVPSEQLLLPHCPGAVMRQRGGTSDAGR